MLDRFTRDSTEYSVRGVDSWRFVVSDNEFFAWPDVAQYKTYVNHYESGL